MNSQPFLLVSREYREVNTDFFSRRLSDFFFLVKMSFLIGMKKYWGRKELYWWLSAGPVTFVAPIS